MRPVFGEVAECRACHGAGQRVLAMTDHEKRERAKQIRRETRAGTYEGERQSPMKPCPDCNGKGYVPPRVADAPR